MLRYVALCLLLVGCASAPKKPAVVQINPTDITTELLHDAGPTATYTLHLDGIHAIKDIDNVQVYLACDVPDPEGNNYPANAHIDDFTLGSEGFSGNRTIDVTEKMRSMYFYDPVNIANFRVVYIITPKNRMVAQDESSFDVANTYFEITKNGKPYQPKQGKSK